MSFAWRENRSWRTRLLSGYALVVALLSAVWAFSLAGPVSQAMEDRQREGLESVANAAVVALSSSELSSESVLNRIAANDCLRLTLVSHEGKVLADSTETVEMGSHAERPEVAAALQGKTGWDRRVSETDGIEYLYVAVPCDAREAGSVLRVSMPAAQAHAALASFRWTSFALLGAAVALAVGVAWLASKDVSRPVRRLERVRTDFVANASHELKTPVAGIRLLSESIAQAAEDGDDRAVKQFSGRLERESARLQSLVTDLMDLSRLEDDLRPSLGGDTCDFATMVATSFEAHLARAQAKGLTLALDDGLGSTGARRVRMSAANATLLVDNLLDNALTYTERGGVTVRTWADEGWVYLEVRDTGIGIPLIDQERVFERFYRVDTARSREAGGTGLGLSLVRHAVRRAGGSISLESTEGVGTSFYVALPMA